MITTYHVMDFVRLAFVYLNRNVMQDLLYTYFIFKLVKFHTALAHSLFHNNCDSGYRIFEGSIFFRYSDWLN